jgi:hypothetical protein
MPSGKAKLVNVMTLYPQRDILGYGNQHGQEQVLDLGTDIEGYGHLYISDFGMGWIARQMGYVKSSQASVAVGDVQRELDEARKRIFELEQQLLTVPDVAERMMESVRSAAIAAVTDLGVFIDLRKGDSGKETKASNGAPVEAAGGDDTPSRKSRRANV